MVVGIQFVIYVVCSQVNQDLFPVGTYTYLVALVIVFLVTDLLRYKPVIVLDGVFAVATWTLLTWGHTLIAMQVSYHVTDL